MKIKHKQLTRMRKEYLARKELKEKGCSINIKLDKENRAFKIDLLMQI